MSFSETPQTKAWFEAAKAGDASSVIELLRSGVDVNTPSTLNATALSYAVRGRHVDVIRILLDHGADLSPEDSFGHTCLTWAVIELRSWQALWNTREPNPNPLEILLAAGAQYRLREAVMLNDFELARIRIDEGADVDAGRGRYHGPLVMIAAKLGHVDMVRLLLDRGANVELTDDLGATALMGAAATGNLEIVRLLLDRGADVNHDDWSDQTPLSEAAVAGHRVIVDLLLALRATRSLLDAVALDDPVLVATLLSRGADPNHLYYGNGRLVSYAVRRGNAEIVRLLLNASAGHHHERLDKRPLLAEAALHGHLDVVRLLIARHADLDAVGRDGLTALALAKHEGHEHVVRCLEQAAQL